MKLMNQISSVSILERPFFTIAGVKINRSSFLFRLICSRQLFDRCMADRTSGLTTLSRCSKRFELSTSVITDSDFLIGRKSRNAFACNVSSWGRSWSNNSNDLNQDFFQLIEIIIYDSIFLASRLSCLLLWRFHDSVVIDFSGQKLQY